MKTKIGGWVARKAGAYVAKKTQPVDDRPLAASPAASKGAVNGLISAGSIYLAIQGIRGFKPDLLPWPAEQDQEMSATLGVTVGAIVALVSAAKNLWKNIAMLRNGLALTKKG